MKAESLEVTKKWCYKHLDQGDMASCLRTDLLKPGFEVQFEDSDKKIICEIERVCKLKRDLLDKNEPPSSIMGKILRFFPDNNTGDGLMTIYSKGYISDNNFDCDMPPWDTLFWYEEVDILGEKTSALLYWVPIEIYSFLKEAIDQGDATDSYQWLDG